MQLKLFATCGAFFTLVLAAGCSTSGPPAPARSKAPSHGSVERDAAWDSAFTRTDGWTCGDIAHAIDLRDGRTLWLFGDSGIGPVADNKHVRDKFDFIRGAGAWHATPLNAGEAPAQLDFLYAKDAETGKAKTWIEPGAGLWPDASWYWLMGDGGIVTTPEGNPRLVLFATALGPSGNPDGMWNFRRVGGVILRVDNVAARPEEWKFEQLINPLVRPEPKHAMPAEPGPLDDWGAAVIFDPAQGDACTAYIFGRRTEGLDQRLLVARVPEQTLDRVTTWQFYDGKDWVADATAAAPLCSGLPSEFTIQRVRIDGSDRFVLIQSENMLGTKILARTARSPIGPWSEPATLFTVPDPATDKRLITYAAKGHAHLSRPDELLISYVINTTDFNQMLDDATLYRPRFIRVPRSKLPIAP